MDWGSAKYNGTIFVSFVGYLLQPNITVFLVLKWCFLLSFIKLGYTFSKAENRTQVITSNISQQVARHPN